MRLAQFALSLEASTYMPMIIGSDRDSGKLCIEPAQPRERLRVLEGGARIHYDHVVKCSVLEVVPRKKMARKRGGRGERSSTDCVTS